MKYVAEEKEKEDNRREDGIMTPAVNGNKKSKEHCSLCCLHLLEYLQRS